MFAKDIMTRDVITVSPTATVKNLAMTLIKNQISGAPVAARNGKIIGVVGFGIALLTFVDTILPNGPPRGRGG